MNAINSLLTSIHVSQGRLSKVADSVASGTVPTATDAKPGRGDRVDISRAAVEMIEAEHQVAVSARTLARIDDAEGALLDVLA